LDRIVYSKLQTQLQKKDHAATKAALTATKVTRSPKEDAILWDPDPALLTAIAAILEREQTFMRKKDSASFRAMTTNIKRLKANAASPT